jgi:heat shock protein 5
VSAEDKGTGKKNNIVINKDQNRLNPEEIEKMINDAEKFAEDDKKVKERVEAKNELESFAYSLKTQVSDKEKLGGKLTDADKETVTKAAQDAIDWLEKNQQADAEAMKKRKKELDDIVQPIMSKLYQQGGPPPGGAGGAGPDPTAQGGQGAGGAPGGGEGGSSKDEL